MKFLLSSLTVLGLTSCSIVNLSTINLHTHFANKLTKKPATASSDLTQFHYVNSFGFAGYASPTFVTSFKSLIIAGSNRSGLWISKDNGSTFVQSSAIPTSADVLGFANLGNSLFISTESGQWLSNDGIQWQQVSKYQVSSTQYVNNVIYLFQLRKGFLQSRDGGKTFTTNKSIPTGFSAVSQIKAFDRRLFIAGNSGFYSSNDNGKTWKLLLSGASLISWDSRIAVLGNTLYLSAVRTSPARSSAELYTLAQGATALTKVASWKPYLTILGMFRSNGFNLFQTPSTFGNLYIELLPGYFVQDFLWPSALTMTYAFTASNNHSYYGSDGGLFEHVPGSLLDYYRLNPTVSHQAANKGLFTTEINHTLYTAIYFPGKIGTKIGGLFEAQI